MHTPSALFVHSYVTFVVSFVVVDQAFVMAVTMVREAVDEVRRCTRDKEMNSQLYSKLTVRGDRSDDRSSIPDTRLAGRVYRNLD